ncbi:MAG: hypothetical protein HQK77_14630, partial [Desulfobacterales bacterium]|nr:hypothetical protein [Desulfobacterales bacterium]
MVNHLHKAHTFFVANIQWLDCVSQTTSNQNQWWTHLKSILESTLHTYHGRVSQYSEHEIVVHFFDSPKDAVNAAIDFLNTLNSIPPLQKTDVNSFRLGIGIHTGKSSRSDISSIAKQLAQRTSDYEVSIII